MIVAGNGSDVAIGWLRSARATQRIRIASSVEIGLAESTAARNVFTLPRWTGLLVLKERFRVRLKAIDVSTIVGLRRDLSRDYTRRAVIFEQVPNFCEQLYLWCRSRSGHRRFFFFQFVYAFDRQE